MRCLMCGNHYRRKEDGLDRKVLEEYKECMTCRARTLYFAECARDEELVKSLRYMAI